MRNKTLRCPFRDVDLLTVQIRAGLTWSRIAEVSRHDTRGKRGRAHARRAYDWALAFLGETPFEAKRSGAGPLKSAYFRLELRSLVEDV
jgi:hypothetical protein